MGVTHWLVVIFICILLWQFHISLGYLSILPILLFLLAYHCFKRRPHTRIHIFLIAIAFPILSLALYSTVVGYFEYSSLIIIGLSVGSLLPDSDTKVFSWGLIAGMPFSHLFFSQYFEHRTATHSFFIAPLMSFFYAAWYTFLLRFEWLQKAGLDLFYEDEFLYRHFAEYLNFLNHLAPWIIFIILFTTIWVGMNIHILCDMMNEFGMAYLYPFERERQFVLGLFRTRSFTEKAIQLTCFVGIIVLVLAGFLPSFLRYLCETL